MVTITLDKLKPHAENRGEMQQDDPHYSVVYFQGEKVDKVVRGKKQRVMVLLPFDADGALVPDNGKTEKWTGLNADGKPITHSPLWNDDMRALLKKKIERAELLKARGGAEDEDEDEVEEDVSDEDLSEDVNFAEWLRGNAKYDWALLVVAGKKRFGTMWTSKGKMIADLVLDHDVVPADELAAPFQRVLEKVAPKTEAA